MDAIKAMERKNIDRTRDNLVKLHKVISRMRAALNSSASEFLSVLYMKVIYNHSKNYSL